MMPRPHEDDSRIVEACINKDITAWAELVKKYSLLISISIKNRLSKYNIIITSSEAEDIKQNILSSIWEKDKLSHIKNRANISCWLAVVSGNTAVEYMSKKEPLRMANKELMEFIPAHTPTPLESSIKKEIMEKVGHALESLPDTERLIIKLSLMHGKKYGEIAEILNLPAGTVSSYLKRAREKLKKNLKYLQ